MSVLTLIQARMQSDRLPGKVLKPILGRPMLEHVIDAAPEPRCVVCPPDDTAILALCRDNDVVCILAAHRKRDVLKEFVDAVDTCERAFHIEPTHVLRLTADCPMLTTTHTTRFLRLTGREADVVYTNRPIDPDGYDMELFPVVLLRRAHELATSDHDREHVGPWLYRNATTTVRVCVVDTPDSTKVSVDTEDELMLVRARMYERRLGLR